VTHTLWLTNTGTMTDTYTLNLSGGEWASTLVTSTVGPLPPGSAMPLTVTVTAPLEAISGTVDSLTLNAVSLGDPRVPPASALAQLETRAREVLPPPEYGVLLAPEVSEAQVAPGASVTYTLVLTNTGTVTDTYTLNLSGGIWTGVLSRVEVGPLAPGSTVMMTVRVIVPLTAPSGYEDTLLLTAISQQDPQAQPASATAQLRTQALWVSYLPLLLCEQSVPILRQN